MAILGRKSKSSNRSINDRPRSMKTQQYYKAKTQPTVPKVDSKKIPWLLYLTLVCLFIGFIYSIVINPSSTLTVNSEVYRGKEAYLSKLNELLSSPLNRNKLTLNTEEIEQKLKQEFPEIVNAGFSVPLIGQNPSVELKVVEPALVIRSGTDSYIVDKQGRAVVKNPTQNVSGLVKLNDQTGFEVRLGEQVLTTEEVSFISYLSSQSKAKGINVKELVLPSSTPAELYLYQNDKNYFVKFFMGGSADVQLGSYLAIQSELDSKSINPEQYVDVRVEERAFIK